jgi:hypothetical protein
MSVWEAKIVRAYLLTNFQHSVVEDMNLTGEVF